LKLPPFGFPSFEERDSSPGLTWGNRALKKSGWDVFKAGVKYRAARLLISRLKRPGLTTDEHGWTQILFKNPCLSVFICG